MRSRAVAATLAGLAVAVGCTSSQPRLPPGTPVVLISIDTLRADHLPAYGYSGVATPHLDRLRRDGVLFERALSPAPMTLPSHVTMLTGQLPPTHGVRNNVGFRFDSGGRPSLPGLLKSRGYATGAAVSSYVLRRDTGLAGLFDFYDDAIDPRPGAAFVEYQRDGGRTVAVAKDWIGRHAAGPFFFFLHLYEPHVPYSPPEPFKSRYPLPYDGEIAAADAFVGELLDLLRSSDAYDRSLILLTSDHGEGLGDHGEEQHSVLLYREAIQVPLIVKLPKALRAGETVAAPAALSDLLPTVAGLLGLPAPEGVDGVALLTGPGPSPDRALYSETLYPRLQLGWSELRSLVQWPWHYIHGPRPELYDLQRDPHEKEDLARTQPVETERLRAMLERVHPLRFEQPQAVDRATAERLAALGYVGGLKPALPAGPLANPRESLGQLATFQSAVREASLGHRDQAVRQLEALVQANPGLVEAWTELGELRFAQGEYQAAATAYSEAIQRNPSPSADVRIALGHAQLRLGLAAQARAAAQLAIAESPTRAHELLARVASSEGHLDEAEREASATEGGRSEAYPSTLLLRAELRVARGDFAGALSLLDEAQKRAERAGLLPLFRLDYLRGDALARLNRLAESEQAYQREIAAFPAHLQAYANLAVLYRLTDRPAGIDPLFERMAEANPGRQAPTTAARVCQALGLRAQATAWERRATASR